MAKETPQICYLCGDVIDPNSVQDQLKLSRDHVPPKQFFPKQVRNDENLNLEWAPSHKKCNNDYKDDEDYFYHSLYPLIANSNPGMAQTVFQDFVRRAHHPQTPALLRDIFSNASRISSGGILLPAYKVVINIDLAKIQRIAGKIARGVVFRKTGDYCPETNIVDMRICETESEVPEMYQLSWKATSIESTYPKVFSFKYFPFLQEYYILSLLFWEAFMFCVTIQQ
ncbi:MAG: hypothetical protein JXM79_04625 [Sedimentisphaerales bacterium]|nr:hypothetical protein [Sedimentisphaerales bacterium]